MSNNESTKWLYDNLTAEGYNVGKDVAEFDSLLVNNEDSRKWAFETAQSLGYNVGKDYDEFSNIVAPAVAVDSEPEEQVNYMEVDLGLPKGEESTMVPMKPTEEPLVDDAPQDVVAPVFTRREKTPLQMTESEYAQRIQRGLDERKYNFGQLRDEQGITAGRQDVVKKGDRYYTPEGSFDSYLKAAEAVDDAVVYDGVSVGEMKNYFSADKDKREEYAKSIGKSAKEIEGAYEAMNKSQVEEQVGDLYKQIDKGMRDVNVRMSDLQRKHNEERNFGTFVKDALMGASVAELPVLQGQIPASTLEGSAEWQELKKEDNQLWAAARQYNSAQKMIEAAKSGRFDRDFDKGFNNAMSEIFFGGAAQDMQDLNAIQEVSRKYEKGEKLTKNEELLLESIAMNVAVASLYQDEISAWYNAGKMTGEMIPLVVEMWMNPLSKLGKKLGQKVIDKAKTKYAKDFAKHKTAIAIKKGLANIGGSVAGGYGMAFTTGLPSVATGVRERTMGDATFTMDKGKVEYAGRENAEGFGEALYKEYTQRMLDNASEMLGAGYLGKPFDWMRRAGKGTKLFGWIDNVASSKYGKMFGDFMEATNWHGPIEEFMEEVHVGIASPLLTGEGEVKDFFKGKNLATVAIGVAVPGAVMGTMATLQGAADGAFKAGAKEKWRMERGDMRAREVWGDKWDDLKPRLKGTSLEELDAALTEIANDNSLSAEQKMAAFDFGIYSLQYQTARGVANAYEDRKDGISAMLRDIYAGAYSAEPTGEAAVEVSDELKLAEENVRVALGLDNGEDVDAFIANISTEELANGDESIVQAIDEYRAAKARFEGVQDRFQDTRDEQYRASDAEIDGRANNGVVYSTYLDGELVYITGGTVLLTDDGMVDVNASSEALYVTMPDGSRRQVPSEGFPGVVMTQDAEAMKNDAREKIDAEWRAQFDGAEAVADEKKKRESGLLFEVEDSEGVHTIEVLEEGDEMSRIKYDGVETKVTTEELNNIRAEVGAVPADEVAEEIPADVAAMDGSVSTGESIPVSADEVAEAPKSALEMIPKDAQGAPMYEQVESGLAWDGVVEEAGGNEEIAMVAVSGMIEDKKKALEKAEKAKAKGGATIAEKIAAENERIANIEKAKAELAKWEEIASVKERRAAAQAENVAQPIAETAPVVESAPVEEVTPQVTNEMQPVRKVVSKKRDVPEMPETVEEFVASVMPKITPESFKRETGLSNGEQRQLVGYIAGKGKGGITIEQAAESIVANYNDELLGLGFTGDEQDVRDMIINILSNGNPKGYIKRSRALREAELSQQEREMADVWAEGMGFDSYENYLDYTESLLEDIEEQRKGFDETEYYNNLAENYEYDTTRERKDFGRGGELLQGEQFVTTTPSEVVGEGYEGTAVPGDVRGGGDNALTQGETRQVNTVNDESVAEGGNAPWQSDVATSESTIYTLDQLNDVKAQLGKLDATTAPSFAKRLFSIRAWDTLEEANNALKELLASYGDTLQGESAAILPFLDEAQKLIANYKAAVKKPTFTEEVLENGDKLITNYNSRGEVEAVALEHDGRIVAVDSYDEGVLFEHTEYDENGVSTSVTRYDKQGNPVVGGKTNVLADHAKNIAKSLGVKVTVHNDASTITNKEVMQAITEGGIVKGWYNPRTGEIALFLPAMENKRDVESTILHEAVSHYGIKHFLGKEDFNKFLDGVWEMMPAGVRAHFLQYVGADMKNPSKAKMRQAADEYVAHIAEKMDLNELEKSVWQRIVDYVMNVLRGRGFTDLTRADIEKVIKASYAGLRTNAEISQAEAFSEGDTMQQTMFRKGNPTLLGTHSITEDKLRKAIRMGGLANPSAAVFELGEEIPGEYGEITFVMPSSMVDKKTGRNTGAFAGDAWTPTYPQVERQMGKRGSARAREDVQSVPKEMQKEVRMGLDSWLDGREGAGLAYMFLQEEGLAPELSRVAQRYSDEIRNRVGEIAHGEPFYRLSPEQKQEIVDLYIEQYYNGDKAYYNNYLNEKLAMMQEKLADVNTKSFIKRSIQQYIDGVNEYGFDYEAVSDFLNKVQRDIDHSGGVNDRATTQEAARVIREKGLEREFQKWKEELLDRYEIKEVVFKGFTPTGNRRYVPHTLENVSKDMKEQGRNGAVGLNASFNKFAAGLLKPLGSLDAIRKRKGNLRATHADTEAFRDKWGEVYYDLAEKLQPDAKGYENYGLDRVAEAATKKDPKAFIKSEYGIELSEADEKALKDMVWAIQNEYPVMYFETKFERPVYLDEFAGVVIPENTGSDVVESLENAGLKIETYEPGNEKARAEAIKRLTEEDDRIMFRRANNNQDIFVSNAQRAVEGIKQEKATPEQWIAMLKKNGGLKAGEEAWLGLETWLNEKQGAVTKQEILEFIGENKIRIEEVEYGESSHGGYEKLDEEILELWREAEGNAYEKAEEVQNILNERYDGFADAAEIWYDGSLRVKDENALAEILGEDNPINSTRLDYTTEGLENKREIALVVPTIEPYNTSDEVHFGDAGNGRAVAWVRFGEATAYDAIEDVQVVTEFHEPYKNSRGNDVYKPVGSFRSGDYIIHGKANTGDTIYAVVINDKVIPVAHATLEDARNAMNEYYKEHPRVLRKPLRVLVIDEIQSKRHQDGREKGYKSGTEKFLKDNGVEVVETETHFEFYKNGEIDQRFAKSLFDNDIDKVKNLYVAGQEKTSVPVAPFEKNWHELAMKRMLRLAAEEGFDKVAWTTGEQQAERYNIGAVLKGLKAYKTSANEYYVIPYNNGAIGELVKEYTEQELADTFGKELAQKIITNAENATEENPYEIEGEELRVGGEGMKGFYDRMLPSFVSKYTKKWGAKVGEVTMPNLGENNTMHSVDVTPEMQESVMEGQTMFRKRMPDEDNRVDYKQMVRELVVPFAKEKREEQIRFRVSEEATQTVLDVLADTKNGVSLEQTNEKKDEETRVLSPRLAVDRAHKGYDRSGRGTGVDGRVADIVRRFNEGRVILADTPLLRDVLKLLRRLTNNEIQEGLLPFFEKKMQEEANELYKKEYRDIVELIKRFRNRNERRAVIKELSGAELGEDVALSKIEELFNLYNLDGNVAELYGRVRGIVKEVGISFGFSELKDDMLGAYSLDRNRILLNAHILYSPYLNNQEKASTIVHEMIHAVTCYAVVQYEKGNAALSPELSDAAKTIVDVYNKAVRNNPDLVHEEYDSTTKKMKLVPDYGTESAYEMVAELSNPDFRDKLKKVDYDGRSVWRRIWDAIKGFLLGNKAEKSVAYDALADAFDSFVDNFDKRMYELSRSNGVTFEKRADAQEDGVRFSMSDAAEEVSTGPLTFMERITKSVLDNSIKNKEALEKRADALRMYGGELGRVLSLMKAQKVYDRATVDMLIRLAKMYFENAQLLGHITPYEAKLILGTIHRATGKRDVSAEAHRLVEILMDAHAKELEGLLEKIVKTKATKVNMSGVEVMGSLDKRGQIMTAAYKDALNLEEKALLDRIVEVEEKLGDKNPERAKEAEAEIEGLRLALEYKREITDRKNELAGLRRDLKEASHSGLKGEALKEFRETMRKSVLECELEIIDAYHGMIYKFQKGVNESSARARAFRQAQIDRVREIQHNANSDMEGRPADIQDKLPKRWNSGLMRTIMGPMATLQTMLKKFGEKSVDGKGYLYNRFMPQVTKASDSEFRKRVLARMEINAKLTEIFGKEMKFADVLSLDGKMKGMKVQYVKEAKFDEATGMYVPVMGEVELSQGQMLYLYMIDKMTDGEMKLRNMGITEEVMAEIKENLDERFVKFADWVQGTFLKDKREEYNAVYERLFGAPMAAIENYFPIRINKLGLTKNEDVAQDAESDMAATVTGSVMKRTRNTASIDLKANAFNVLMEHVDEMEHWAAFAELNRDMNTLLSYKHFRNQVMNMKTVRYGSGKVLWDNFKDVARIATQNYRPKTAGIDKAVVNLTKAVSAAKINFRVYTALKQLLSAPAFWTEAGAKELAAAYFQPRDAWRWAIENLPGFAERWQGRKAGNEKLLPTDKDWRVWRTKFVEGVTRVGMWPNAAVDALVVSVGAKAVYETKLKAFKNAGYADEVAKKKALQAASEAYNESQQSSEGAYMSAMQMDRTFLAATLTTFKNSNFGYTRKTAQSIANLARKMKGGYKEQSVAFMAKMYEREGLTAEQARALAEKMYRRSTYKDAANVAMYGFALNVLWALGGSAVYLLFGDDDDEKEELLLEALGEGLLGGLQGVGAGDALVDLAKAGYTGDWKYFSLPGMPAMADVENITQMLQYDTVRGAQELLNMLVSAGVGVNPQVFADVVVALADMDGVSLEELGLFILRTINAPQSQVDRLLVDKALRNGGEDLELMMKRFAEYKMNKQTPLTKWMYGDEAEQKAVERNMRRFDSMLDERLENVVEDELAFEMYYDNASPAERANLAKMRAEYLAKEEGLEKPFAKLSVEEILKQVRYGKKFDDAVFYDVAQIEDVEDYWTLKRELAKSRKAYEGFKKADERTKAEFAEEMQKEAQHYYKLNAINSAINHMMNAMEENPASAEAIMNDVRRALDDAVK